MMTEPAPGKLFEANACYVPADKTSSQLLLVDCKDFTKVLNPTPVGEVTIVLQPPREEFRKVIISALPRLEDCDCGEPNDIKTHSIFEICNVSPLSRVDSVSRSAKELCSDEVGVSFDATCTLQSDDRTVRITGTFKLFEDAADTCGADDKEDEKSFDVKVGPGVTTKVPLDVLYNYDVCGLADCNDTANINDFTISNQVD